MTEPATVEDTFYQASMHGSTGGVGLGMDGNISFHSGSVYVPEKYVIVFKCQHGKFIIEGGGDRNKRLWSVLSKGDNVIVYYKENYLVSKKHGKQFTGYDFIDAEKVN